MAQDHTSPRRKALVYSVDANEFPLALFAARRAALMSQNCDFDILICSLEPLVVPDELQALGIHNVHLNLLETIQAQRFPLKRLPIIAYLRLWLPDHFSNQYDRILYNDADTCLGSTHLSRLFDVDMGRHPIAAVRDVHQWPNLQQPLYDFAARNLGGLKYFNSGVMLFDTATYRDTDMLGQLLRHFARDRNLALHDQSLLNLVTRGEWAELNPVWNWQWANANPQHSARANPQLMHFCGPRKPWKAHLRRTNFAPELIDEYQQFFAKYAPERGFELTRPGGRRPLPWTTLISTLRQRATRGQLDRLIGRFATPFDTLL